MLLKAQKCCKTFCSIFLAFFRPLQELRCNFPSAILFESVAIKFLFSSGLCQVFQNIAKSFNIFIMKINFP